MRLNRITKDELLNYVNDVLIQYGTPLDIDNMVITTYSSAPNNIGIAIMEHDNIDSVINVFKSDNDKTTFFVDYKLLDEYITMAYIEVGGYRSTLSFDFSFFGDAYKTNTCEKITHYKYEDILKKENLIKLMAKI